MRRCMQLHQGCDPSSSHCLLFHSTSICDVAAMCHARGKRWDGQMSQIVPASKELTVGRTTGIWTNKLDHVPQEDVGPEWEQVGAFPSEQVEGHRIAFREELAEFTSRQRKLASPMQFLWLISTNKNLVSWKRSKNNPLFPKSI